MRTLSDDERDAVSGGDTCASLERSLVSAERAADAACSAFGSASRQCQKAEEIVRQLRQEVDSCG